MADSKEDETQKLTEVYILSLTVKKANGLPDLDNQFSKKDVTDPGIFASLCVHLLSC